MLHSLYRAGLIAAFLGLLLVPGTMWATQAQRPRKVSDEAKMFGDNAVDEANATIEKIKTKHHKDLWIETRDKVPGGKNPNVYAKERADEAGIDGVYILITKDPKHFEVYVGNKTREKGYFTDENREAVKKILSSNLGKNADKALLETANYTLTTMDRHTPAQGKAAAPVVKKDHDESHFPPWVGWVCAIIGILFVVWIIFAIIRAMTGMMGGGYGPGYGGGGYGGGGGGFFTGMLGGLFGSMAGMWLYNNMFGGHATYGPNGSVNWGGGSQTNTGDGSTPYEADTGGTTSGGSYGDEGGGGGDAGGDAGGGGDWGGGGGGDAGGGGGGDWGGGGGGGGGDWGGGGGGGGDWGGGGGGGDWGGGGGGGGGGDW